MYLRLKISISLVCGVKSRLEGRAVSTAGVELGGEAGDLVLEVVVVAGELVYLGLEVDDSVLAGNEICL